MTLERHSPMPRGDNPLQRNVPLRTYTELRTTTPLLRTVELERTPLVSKPRNTGPRRSVTDMVKDRARAINGQDPDDLLVLCEMCGLLPSTTTHHRDPRGMGGSGDPAKNLPSNLVRVDDICHRHAESQREIAYIEGWLVHTDVDPCTVPIRLGTAYYLLDNDGGATQHEPEEAA